MERRERNRIEERKKNEKYRGEITVAEKRGRKRDEQ